MLKKLIIFLWAGILCSGAVQAAPIQRTITVDGDISDWTTAPDITTNAGQFSVDGDGRSCPSTDLDTGSPCSALTPGGRDLQRFAYTWDANKVYIYVTRWGTTNNVTDWWFYLDTNNNGRMQDGEPVFRVSWQGNNQNTDRVLYLYDAVDNTNGDLLVNPAGDGYTMPGGITGGTALVSLTGGTADQAAMESELLWSDLGLPPNSSIGFHIASSNGTNLPNSVIDNMDGPGGGGFAFPDLAVGKTVSADPVYSGNTFTYTVTITNNGDADATGISLTDQLPQIPAEPADVNYVSHVASQGTYDSGTGVWNVGDIPYTQPTLTTATLTITATAGSVATDTTVTNTANNLVLDQADPVPGNNSASVDVLIRPAPELAIEKSRSTPSAKPNEFITYTLEVTNVGVITAPVTEIHDILSPYTALGMDAMPGGQTLDIRDGEPCGNASGLSFGTVVFANDRPPTYGYAGAGSGYDPLVTAWQVPITGSMDVGECFTVEYQVQVK